MNEQIVIPYRIFISYSHEDRLLAEKVCRVIKDLEMEPLWDETFASGRGFHEQIKTYIAHAHVFLPIITESSNRRGWVHQEIGYAAALNIPILPLAWVRLPDEMLQSLHGVLLPDDADDHESVLRVKLTQASIHHLESEYRDERYATYTTAPLSEDRAQLMTAHANEVKRMGRTAMLRQKGGLSSMHIPDEVTSHPVWKERYGQRPKGAFHYRCQREERLALEFHARQAGYKLILNPSIAFSKYGEGARLCRLRSLLVFLSSTEDSPNYQVAFLGRGRLNDSVTILGDWFYAESVSPSSESGYLQTIFTRHAPTMQAKIAIFDREFEELLTEQGWKPEESKARAIASLSEVVSTLGP